MLKQSAEWPRCVSALQQHPHDTFDHRLGNTLAASDESQSFAVLVDIIIEDPPTTHEYAVAAEMLSHFTGTPQ